MFKQLKTKIAVPAIMLATSAMTFAADGTDPMDTIVTSITDSANDIKDKALPLIVTLLGIAVLFKGIPVLWGIAKRWLGNIGK